MLQGLNSAQRDAVKSVDGPLLVLAGAGSGKTRVITYRIAHLIRSGVAADRILAVTFTNKAAQEMQQRAAGLLGKRRRSRPLIATFHSLCVKILRGEIELLGYPREFAIFDRLDQEGAARAALRDIKCPTAALRPSDLLYRISRWKMLARRSGSVGDLLADERDELAAAAYRRYELSLKAAGALDFDDLLLCTQELFRDHPAALRRQQGRFDHILVDEYQDTNAIQFGIISTLAGPHRNLCVVGDDDQSIYGWRGAEIENILGFDREYPDAKVVRLEENYRSTPEVLALANQLIQYNAYRRTKTLRPTRPSGRPPRFVALPDEVDEAKYIATQIRGAVEKKLAELRDFAILFRTNEQPRLFETELRAAQLPYVLIGGMSFFDRREVRDLLGYLKFIANPNDEVSLLRIINRPARGIGEATVAALLQRAVHQATSLWNVLPDAQNDGEVPLRAAESIARFQQSVGSWRSAFASSSLTEAFRTLVHQIDYQSHLQRTYKDATERQGRWNTVEELVNAVSQYEERSATPSLERFLEEIALAGREEDKDQSAKLDRNAVVLMTLHSAKGLEFPNVYLVGMEEGLLPHERAVAEGAAGIAEERRLAYVGVTRAMDRLTLTHAQSRTKWGKRRASRPSRFLAEMNGEPKVPKPRKTAPARKASAKRRKASKR